MSFFCRATAMAVLLGCAGNAMAASEDSPAALPVPQIKICETTFFDIPLPDNASQCQPFSDALKSKNQEDPDVPASLVYFTPLSTQAVIDFYQAQLSLNTHAPVNQRTLLVSEDSQIRIVVSPDNKGSQVDILVSLTSGK